MDDGIHDAQGRNAQAMRGERVVNERVKELASDAARWGKEALEEWWEGVTAYPIPNLFSLILGALLCKVVGWLL